MPKKKEVVTIRNYEENSSNDLRVIRLEINAPSELFRISDCCAEEGAILSLKKQIEGGLKRAIHSYLESGREFFKSAKSIPEVSKKTKEVFPINDTQ